MKKEILIAGFGGQGVMAIGKNLVQAGMSEGREVTWVPTYGPEMRGGTSNCSVILADEPVGAPIVSEPTDLIAMNEASLEKYAPTVRSGGLIFLNGSAAKATEREDVAVYPIPCIQIASELGNPRAANMVMLGAYAAATGTLRQETLEGMVRHMFSGPKAHLAELNIRALQAGMDCARQFVS